MLPSLSSLPEPHEPKLCLEDILALRLRTEYLLFDPRSELPPLDVFSFAHFLQILGFGHSPEARGCRLW